MQFAQALKDWRRRRGYSQERLGFEANVSTRHIAFMETGRAQPSRHMVVRLSEALEMPRDERNDLLEAAGFAALYVALRPGDADMANIRSGISWMLERHDPFPAFSIDRHWHILMHNKMAGLLLGQLNLKTGDSLLDAALSPNGLRQFIVNWPDVARYFAERLRTESRSLGGDPRLTEVAAQLLEGIDPDDALGPKPAVLQTRYRIGGLDLAMFSTIAQFGSADDLALADVRVEYLFPADDATRATLFELADGIHRPAG
jgi:transcriptional regulator with XRE-family HTH domain